MAYVKSYISKIESGQKPPTAGFARACDLALDANGELVLLAELTTSGPAVQVTEKPSERADWPQVLAALLDRWHTFVQVDNLHGPVAALDGVTDGLTTIHQLLQHARGETRAALLRVAARYAESARLALRRPWQRSRCEPMDRSRNGLVIGDR